MIIIALVLVLPQNDLLDTAFKDTRLPSHTSYEQGLPS